MQETNSSEVGGFFGRIRLFFRKYWVTMVGASIYKGLSWIYDNPLWIATEFIWHEQGAIGMMTGAFIINTTILVFFQNKKTDFILWSALDELSEKESEYHEAYVEWGKSKNPLRSGLLVVTYIPVKLAMFLLWCLKESPRLGDIAGFFILSFIEDPFVVTMYLRHGYKNGLRVRDYAIYLTSSVISITYWAIRNAAIVELVFRPAIKIFF